MLQSRVTHDIEYTPEGRGYFCYLVHPDKGFGGEKYSVRLRLYPKGMKVISQWLTGIKSDYDAWIETATAEAHKNKKKLKLAPNPVKDGTDNYGPYTEIHFYQNRFIKGRSGDQVEMYIGLVDSDARPCKPKHIGDGSIMRLQFLRSYYNSPAQGVGLRFILRGAQIIDLIDGPGGPSMGFTPVQGSYKADSMPTPTDNQGRPLIPGTPIGGDDDLDDIEDLDTPIKINGSGPDGAWTEEDLDIAIDDKDSPDTFEEPTDGADF